ncbi:MAG: hypothetical protein OEY78_03685 [Gammaproteobacteria bacterium]|nr:hypothetical protein [Gammaproteobacteria bacterium]
MNENNEIEKKDMTKANIWIAVALGIIALTVAITPFFYLNNAVITG